MGPTTDEQEVMKKAIVAFRQAMEEMSDPERRKRFGALALIEEAETLAGRQLYFKSEVFDPNTDVTYI